MDVFSECLAHFKKLIQFNTTNPPGNERQAIQYINEVLQKEGLQPLILESADKRANLIVRIKGDGSHRPLHITSHIDVVTSEADKWKFPPFSATEAEGCIWGRGALDMKNMTAYCLGSVLTIKRSNLKLKRDLIMSVVADEETGGKYGMGWLVQNHPDLIRAEYALGEVGGYSVHLNKKRFYPIQVGEKGSFWIKIKFHGRPGHGSIPGPHNVHFKVSRFLNLLNSRSLPYHETKTTKAFLKSLGGKAGALLSLQFKILDSDLGPIILRKMTRRPHVPDKYLVMGAMLSNTANPTGVESGYQHNVVPSEVILKLDCRTLPGLKGQDVIYELEKLYGEKLEYEVVNESQGYESNFDTPLFKEISKQIIAADPLGIPVPSLTVGSTDAHYLNTLGVTCYGFTPLQLTPDLNFSQLFHGHNERIPIEGFKWGFDVFIRTINSFCCHL